MTMSSLEAQDANRNYTERLAADQDNAEFLAANQDNAEFLAANQSNTEALDSIALSFSSSFILSDPSLTVVTTFYVILTCIAVFGNLSVILVMVSKKNLRTTRNVFILLLAISDLLSAACIPLTVLDGLSRSWILGPSPIMCRLVKTLPNLAVFMSSFTIVAIAFDRYIVICRPTRPQISFNCACMALPGVMLLAAACTAVLFIKTRLLSLGQLLTNQGIPVNAHNQLFSELLICVEDWNDGAPMHKEDRLYYTVFSFTVQFLLPLVVIVVVYAKIYLYIKDHQYSMTSQRSRMKRTSMIFFLISLIFCASWLPFCIYCILTETLDLFADTDAENMMLVYCITHMIGMSSSCSNPVLYAFMNTNFSKEFRRIPEAFFQKICPSKSRSSDVTIRLANLNKT